MLANAKWSREVKPVSSRRRLTATGGAAAVLAFVACAVGHHQHAAFGARGRTLVLIARFGGLRIGERRRQAHRFGHGGGWGGRRGCRRGRRGTSGGHNRPFAIQLFIIGREEASARPAPRVV